LSSQLGKGIASSSRSRTVIPFVLLGIKYAWRAQPKSPLLLRAEI